MEFTGSQLVDILNRQWPECLVEIGRELVEPAVASFAAATDDFIGVGHFKRIMYLRPRYAGVMRTAAFWKSMMPQHVTPAKVSGCPQARAQMRGGGVLRYGGRAIAYEKSDPDGVRAACKIGEDLHHRRVLQPVPEE